MKILYSIFNSDTLNELKKILNANKKYLYLFIFIAFISSFVEYFCVSNIFKQLETLDSPLKIDILAIVLLWSNILILSITRILSTKVICISGSRISSSYAVGVVEEIFNKSYLWHRNKDKNVVINALTQQQSYALSTFVRPIFQAFLSLCTSLALITAMFKKYGEGTILFLFLISTLYLFSILSVRKRIQEFSIKQALKEDKRMSIVVDGISAIRDIYVNNRKKILINDYRSNTAEVWDLGGKIHFLSSLPKLFLDIIVLLIIGFVVSFSSSYNSILNFSYIVSFGLSFQRLFPNIISVGSVFNTISAGKGSLLAVNKLRKNSLEYDKKYKNIILGKRYKSEIPSGEWDKLEILNFKRNWTTTKINSFEINKFKIHGISGISGSGKTTLVDIISGLLPVEIPKEYKIYIQINGLRQKEFISKSFSSNNYYITQDTYLERETIEQALKKNSVSLFNFKEIMNIVCLEKYISNYQNRLTSDLSGGEKKRLAIAKALVSRKKIIVMDEITNGLDNSIKKTILKGLSDWKEKNNLTYIVISHDEDVLKWCDNIFRL